MKKILSVLSAALILLSLTACGGSARGQTVNFQGISMDIPKDWKAEKSNSDDYAVYKKLNSKGHDYKLQFSDKFSLLETFNNDLERAGAFFLEVTEDDASYKDPSEPVAGKLGGKYDMHVIDCTLCVINPSKDGWEAEYPCKLVRVYMEGHDVEIRFSSEKGDFGAFDAALAAATCS